MKSPAEPRYRQISKMLRIRIESGKLPKHTLLPSQNELAREFGVTPMTVLRALERMPRCRMTRWNPYGVDIIAEGGSKAKGMERLLAHFGAAREETIAFGDGENDMEMLGYAGIGVAMGNAEEKVKACADYVTEAADRGGILSALRHFDIL